MAGSDYTSVSSVQTFTSGSNNGSTRCIDIRITDDNAFEGNESFRITLSTADSNVVLGTDTDVTITDYNGVLS